MPEDNKPTTSTDPIKLAQIAARRARVTGGSPEEALQRLLDANADVAEHLALVRDEVRSSTREQQADSRETRATINSVISEFKGSSYDELERLRREREAHGEHSRELLAAARDLQSRGLVFFQAAMRQWNYHLWCFIVITAAVLYTGYQASRDTANSRQLELKEHQVLYDKVEAQQKDIAALKKKFGVQ